MRHTLTEKDTEALTAVCAVDGPVELIYRKHKNEYVCKVKLLENARRYQKRVAWKAVVSDGEQYGVHYTTLLEKQDGKCALCGEVFTTSPQLDHDHETGKIRGLLCRYCNLGLGHFKDNISTLTRAIEYLQ